MLGPQDLMRKAELERSASPEQLDLPMTVTSPAGWTALLAILAGLAAVVAWSVFGSLPIEVDGVGMLLQGENVGTVQAPVAGRVVEVQVEVGDTIAAGDVVATLDLAELQNQIDATEKRIGDLERQGLLQLADWRRQRGAYERQLSGLRERLRAKQGLQAKGLARRQDILAIEGEIAQVEGQLLQIDLSEEEFAARIRDEKRTLEQLQADQKDGSEVISPVAGRVAAVLVTDGVMIDAGGRILNLEAAGEPYQLVLYVALAEGKRAEAGMPVRIAPSTIKPEEYGYIRGVVLTVSAQPVTPEQVRSTLNNDQLVEQFIEGTPYEVVIDPDPDRDDVFEWTTSKGQELDIESNTPCSARITVGERAPIELVIPYVKKTLGFS
ncbi:MAG: NHLP bacteriocin system secretion protein [Acidobacteriota bacterium]